MILLIIDIIFLCYLGMGLFLWFTPIGKLPEYIFFGNKCCNFLFIFFWLPALLNERIWEIVSK